MAVSPRPRTSFKSFFASIAKDDIKQLAKQGKKTQISIKPNQRQRVYNSQVHVTPSPNRIR